MRNQLIACAALITAGFGHAALAADSYLGGNISNITSHAGALMVMLDNGVPTNCTGVGYGWMTIPEANKTMIVTALIAWQLGRAVMVYTNALAGGVCTITQFDPAES